MSWRTDPTLPWILCITLVLAMVSVRIVLDIREARVAARQYKAERVCAIGNAQLLSVDGYMYFCGGSGRAYLVGGSDNFPGVK